jgi:hypothetical protein
MGRLVCHLSRVTISSDMSFVSMYIIRICTVYMSVHDIKMRMYMQCIQYIEGLCGFRLNTAYHALTLVAHAATVV